MIIGLIFCLIGFLFLVGSILLCAIEVYEWVWRLILVIGEISAFIGIALTFFG